MYMTSVFMIARDIGCRWDEVPIDRWPVTLNVAFDLSYPFVRYENAVSWKGKSDGFLRIARKNRGRLTGCVFMNPSRRSISIWALSDASYDDFIQSTPEELEGSDWVPEVNMLQEFTVSNASGARTTKCKTMDGAMQSVFSMGFGPCPYYRRSGVALYASVREGGTPMIGCIVPHRHGVHGCVHSRFRQCYVCPQNPFYEALFSEDGGTVRIMPMLAACSVIEVGARMLLSVSSRELQGRPSQCHFSF